MTMMTDINDEACPLCGSRHMVQGTSHYECSGCGAERDRLEADPGFVPQTGAPSPLRASDNVNDLGSQIAKTGDSASERLRKANERSKRRNPLFIDLAISEIVKACGVNSVSEDAASLLIEVNKAKRLGGVRKKRRGTSGMQADESKEYRARTFAAAALHIRNSEGQSNTAPQVAAQWGVRYLDLVSAVRLLNRHRRSEEAEGREPPRDRRSRELRHEAERHRSFLAEQYDMDTVNRITEEQVRILRDEGEPFQPDDEWHTGRFCNDPTPRAAFEAVVEAMAELGLPRSSARLLFQRLPINGMNHFMERSAHLFEL